MSGPPPTSASAEPAWLTGDVVRHLLLRAADPAAEVRLTVLKLLTDLCPSAEVWPAVADVAAADLDSLTRR
ncbi:hypothetical protein ABZ814_06190 [Micromonospora musae]|uniref:hypothetical protein n=1 Tax=Micromonospora musae TaxID=1894970 RepID=UPI0033C1B32A